MIDWLCDRIRAAHVGRNSRHCHAGKGNVLGDAAFKEIVAERALIVLRRLGKRGAVVEVRGEPECSVGAGNSA